MDGSVRKRGDSWYYRLELPKINNQRQQLERCGGKTKAEALKAMREAINELETAGQVFDLSNMSVADYFDYWYENYVLVNLKYNTQINYAAIIKNHLNPQIGHYRLSAIRPGTLQELLNSKFQAGYAKKTLVLICTVMRNAFKKAVYPYQFLKEDPSHYIKIPHYDTNQQKSREELKIISLKEFQQLQQAISEDDSFYSPMMIAFHTGLRRGEVCGLMWSDINFHNQSLTVERIMINKGPDYELGTPKTQSSYRTIPLGKTLVDYLKRRQRQQKEQRLFYGQYYFSSDFINTKENGEPVTPNSIKWSIGRYRRLTGINFNFHSFRHTHATMLLESDVKPKSIQHRLGHSKIATTLDTYAHITSKLKNESVDAFEALLRDQNS